MLLGDKNKMSRRIDVNPTSKNRNFQEMGKKGHLSYGR